MASETWNLKPPPGFQGLHPDIPVTFYYRHLPHWRQDGATYFVTFRLADSLPQAKLRELEALKREWLRKHRVHRMDWRSSVRCSTDCQSAQHSGFSQAAWEAFAKMLMQTVEKWLDNGMGACWLKRSEMRQHVIEALHHFDGDQYELGCYVVMPNHVHALIRPLRPVEYPLEKILQGRKRHSSHAINARAGRSGTLWQEESFDRIVRDEEHLWRCIQYIGRNPGNAELPSEHWSLWIRPSWEACGWRFTEK